MVPAAIALATTISLAGACTTHGAGGRCDPRNVPAGTNQNADCDDGLVCISGAELQLPDAGGSPQGDFCCPPANSAAAAQLDPTNICHTSATTIGDDASIADTGTTDTSTPTDATTDDGASDAPSESSIDSGDAATDAVSE